MITVNASSVFLSPAMCKENTNITSIDLKNTPFIGNCMHKAFYNCTALISVTNINSNVVDMSSTFTGCSNLTTVSTIPQKVKTLAGIMYKDTLNIGGAFSGTGIMIAPTIPGAVTNMLGTFSNCQALIDGGTIPSSVTDMRFCYSGCTNLTTIPTIPSSVTSVQSTYAGCTALSGKVFIESYNITDASNCFDGTSLRKYVYIPFKYANNTNSATYNAFIAAGYDIYGTKDGVSLKDISDADQTSTYEIDDTKYSFTFSGTTAYLEKYIGSDTNVILPGVQS